MSAKSKIGSKMWLKMVAALLAVGPSAWGMQSENHGIVITPVKGEVTVDGDVSEWDWSGRIWLFADKSLASRYSTEIAAMWDADYLYLAAHYKDPTPLFNLVDPVFNPNDGWKADSMQLRILTDRPIWVTAWYYSGGQKPVLRFDYWKDHTNPRAGQDGVLLYNKGDGDPSDVGGGARLAYKADADGKGYVQEMRIPWSMLYAKPPTVAPGLTFRLGAEVLWGDPTGNTFPTHRYADNLQPDNTSREFFWSNLKGWGDATLSATGDVPVKQYVDEANRIAGTIPIRLAIPKSTAKFTIAIDDAQGNRVRNLGGDLLPDDYKVDGDVPAVDQQLVEVKWDGLDDKGQTVSPGEYRVRGLTHGGLGAEYEMCFYNPGTPPWPVAKGSGGWGADHSAPTLVATAGDHMIAAWSFAEGGSGIIGIGPDGLKKWGEKRGASALAADDKYVYAITNSWHDSGRLCRFSKTDGAYHPFTLAGKERPFELPLGDISPELSASGPTHPEEVDHAPAPVSAMAAGGGKLVLAMPNGKLAVVDSATAKLLKLLDVKGVSSLAIGADGACVALVDGALCTINLNSGEVTKRRTPGLAKAGSIAIAASGNVAVMDLGPDQQVKVYSADGAPIRTAGVKGGRPIRGQFNPQALSHVSSIAFDAKGDLWAVESWNYPRRVSVWGNDGALVRDYVGNTGYAGVNSYFHETDPSVAYVGPIELKLDRAAGTWQVGSVLWVPDVSKGERFGLDVVSNVHPQRFTSDASGTPREYLYTHDPRSGGGHVVYMGFDDGWRPVSAVCYGAHVSGKLHHNTNVAELPSSEFADIGAYDVVFWNDANADGKPQRPECDVIKSKDPGVIGKKGKPAVPLLNGWGGRIGRDMVFYTDGIHQFRPDRFTEAGAPVYTRQGMTKMSIDDNGDLVPVPEEDLLLMLSFKGYATATTGMVGVDTKGGQIKWTYPNRYPGVHGSHKAPMPSPGLVIGPLKILGVADIGGNVGRVFALRGNLGQDYFFTTDGLFVGSMFQDGRLPGESLPDKEERLKGVPMESFSNGSEPFNGWFGKQSDGKVRMLTGFPRQAAMSLLINGLESINRLPAQTVAVDEAILAKAATENVARAAAAAGPKRYVITRADQPPKIDGAPSGWDNVKSIDIKRVGMPQTGMARLSYDAQNLYVLFDVEDPTPMRNEGRDFTRLFKTGDAVDLQIGTDPTADTKRANPVAGDLRVVISMLNGKPAAVLMRPVDKSAGQTDRVNYQSPVGEKVFDVVRVMTDAKVQIKPSGGSYVVEAALPLASLGLKPESGLSLRGDVGFISSDASGTINAARTYWANPDTNLLSDLPIEAWLAPAKWGEFVME